MTRGEASKGFWKKKEDEIALREHKTPMVMATKEKQKEDGISLIYPTKAIRYFLKFGTVYLVRQQGQVR